MERPEFDAEPIAEVVLEADMGAELSQLPASRHYRRARQDRGAETRKSLLLAALDVFGRYGFEGAATRDIAKRAGANLAAIVYHFGSKDALHRAVAEYVVEQMQARIGDSITAAADALKGNIDRPTARRLLQRIVDVHIDSMLGEAEAELWGRFIMREQMEPSSTFDVIYDFMMQCQSTTTNLVALLLDLDPRSEEATLRSFAISGQFVIFCVGRPMVLKKLGRDTLATKDREEIRRVVAEHIDLLVGEALVGEG
ncbi:CerR family C-terminal domain-containing protein [Kaistia defluvii]|uniref:CerR family C-terminal domain-containing protein n=1 Tax=Kaistia defluvii TaxID=410841 RepID=UPI00224FB4E1|nr:CerR family C-terminal domain-containing protein [Kaistia defluvii]MCX5518158.1 CerR family C-terminal domain-containing protein [Kaistia defluvii]